MFIVLVHLFFVLAFLITWLNGCADKQRKLRATERRKIAKVDH